MNTLWKKGPGREHELPLLPRWDVPGRRPPGKRFLSKPSFPLHPLPSTLLFPMACLNPDPKGSPTGDGCLPRSKGYLEGPVSVLGTQGRFRAGGREWERVEVGPVQGRSRVGLPLLVRTFPKTRLGPFSLPKKHSTESWGVRTVLRTVERDGSHRPSRTVFVGSTSIRMDHGTGGRLLVVVDRPWAPLCLPVMGLQRITGSRPLRKPPVTHSQSCRVSENTTRVLK